MAPPDPATAHVARLVAAVRNDAALLVSLKARLDQVSTDLPWPEDAPVLYLVAVTLDHYYSACEAIVERIVRAFEGPPAQHPRWHKELLAGASLGIPGIRPAIFTARTVSGLMELLEFRHFMRHAYGVSLRPGRLAELAGRVVTLDPAVHAELDAFCAMLLPTPD